MVRKKEKRKLTMPYGINVRNIHRVLGIFLSAVMVFNMLPAGGISVYASEEKAGFCEHHTEHTADCGYQEAQPRADCTHEHTEDCYKIVENCIHEHMESCYPEEISGEEKASSSDAEEKQPTECSHLCSEENGCIIKELDCHHEHDESCGYREEIKGSLCTFVCKICNGETSEKNTSDNEINDGDSKNPETEKEDEIKEPGNGQEECICKELCVEGNGNNGSRINMDCPVCGTEDASLSNCKGKDAEESTETVEENTEQSENTGICKHHPKHDGSCGYQPVSEDREGSPCTYECHICPIEELIAALPDTADITEDNADDVRAQLDEILALYQELTEDEQEQIDLSRCYELQEALDKANASMLAEVSVAYQEADWNGSEVVYTEKNANCTPVENSAEAVTWSTGWYAVSGTVTISEPITVSGEVHLILMDGCNLTAAKGIVVTTGNSLTIYAQSGGTGTLNATGTTDSSNNASAGIGGSTTIFDSGSITIHGGVINAAGGYVKNMGGSGAGIGGGGSGSTDGNGGDSSAITIYNGVITAVGGELDYDKQIAAYHSGAGIGGGSSFQSSGGTGNSITIYGGTVTAKSQAYHNSGAGIGGGAAEKKGGGSSIAIYGGNITATSDRGDGIGGAGIGGGGGIESGDGTVTISGGIVTAVGGKYAAGIGGGGGNKTQYITCVGGTGNITITGGIVDSKGGAGNSTGDYAGTPIGNGGNASGGSVEKNTGIVFENGEGIVCGDVTFDGSYEVPVGYSLNIPAGASLSGSGTLSGGGTFTIETLTEDMISVSDIHYTSEDMTEDIKGKVTISGKTVCGQTFMVDTDSWTLSVAKVSDMEYTATYTHEEKGTVSKTVKILPCLHSNGAALTHHEGKAADCMQTGVKEYWDCSVCGKKFSDEDGRTEITETEIPIADHTLTHHEGKAADCTQTGVVEYWDCSICGKKFSDNAGQTEIADADIVISVKPHTLTHHERQEAACTAAGNTEYWDCSVCGKNFSDQGGQTEITDADIVIPVKPHTLTRHAGVEAGCLTEGNIEYWSCSVCSRLFSDADGKIEVTDIKIPAKGHDYVAWKSNGNGTHTHSCQTLGCGFTETEDCSGGTATYTEKAKCEICGGEYGELLKDASVPTGEIIIGTNNWNSFLNTITFGLFFNKIEQVTITAEDKESGIASVSYFISGSGLSEEEVKKLDNWTAGNTDKTTFNISPDKSCVVYASITDKQGNVTYISSDGLVFDGTFPSIIGIADGETYCTSQEVSVTDNNSESVTVTVNGKEQTLSDGKFTLDMKFDTATIVIAAEDKAGNVTTVTVYAGHNYGTDWKPDSNGHWQECAVCGNKSEVLAHTEDSGTVTKPATQTETGIRTYKCSVCGYEMRTEIIEKLPESHTHSYGTEWKFDNNNHWHECDCGAKSDSGTHTEDSGTVTKPATETETGIRTYKCSVCGYEMRTEIIEKLPEAHKHSYGTEWKSDSNSHWHECSCGNKSDSAAHTEDSGTVTKPATETETGIRTYKCSVCGYEMRTEIIEKLPEAHKHSYGTEWKSDSNSHWHECSCGNKSDSAAHTEDSGTVTKPATETETGIRTYKCSVCGYEMRTEIIEKLPEAHKHSYGTEWKSDSNSHWHECSCGNKSDSAAHTEDSGTVTKPATETETGIRTYKCSVCGYEMRTEIIEKLPESHKHSYGTEWKSDNSNHWHECSCGEKSSTAAHTWDNGTVTVKPTTDKEGEKTFTCTVCGKTKTESVEKLPATHTHSYGTEWKSDNSNHWHECSCGEKSGTAAHIWDNGTVTVKPTTDKEGEKTFTCTVCGRTKTETIGKLPESHKHSYGTEWKSDNNNHWHECICGEKSGTAAHTWDSGTVTVKPTTDREGERTYTCTVCGRTKTETIGKLPPSHTESSQPEDKKPDNNSNQPDNKNTGANQPDSPGGGSGNTEDTKSDAKIPFIKNQDSKNGWNVIRTEEEKAEEGSIINVDMNGFAVVPGDIFDSIKGKDITITFDMGNGIIWSVNGKSITTGKAGDIDFSVKTGINAIPVDVVNSITGERYSIQLSLSHEGEFGFTAVLSINLGKDNAGLTANLYYYNESTGELESIYTDTVAEDGTVSLAFTHASDYVVVIDENSMEQETGAGSTAEVSKTGKESTPAGTTDSSVKNDLWNRIWVFVLCGVLVIAGLGIFFVRKKKKDE